MKYKIIIIAILCPLLIFGQNYGTLSNLKIDTVYQYDTVKCIVQAYSPNNGLKYTTPEFFAIKGWVVRLIVNHNNTEGIIDPSHYYGFLYKEWLTHKPVKFLLKNKRDEVKDVWMPGGNPQHMLIEWK